MRVNKEERVGALMLRAQSGISNLGSRNFQGRCQHNSVQSYFSGMHRRATFPALGVSRLSLRPKRRPSIARSLVASKGGERRALLPSQSGRDKRDWKEGRQKREEVNSGYLKGIQDLIKIQQDLYI